MHSLFESKREGCSMVAIMVVNKLVSTRVHRCVHFVNFHVFSSIFVGRSSRMLSQQKN
jgi:hypothetical protein